MLREDLRYVARGLWRSRAFTTAAILTLAAGAAAAILVFTLVRSVLGRPLPVRDQQALIVAWRDLPASGFLHDPFGDRAIERAAANRDLFSDVAGVDANGVGREVLVDGGVSTPVNGAVVTGRFFTVLGVTPALGRALGPSDDVDGAEPVLVLGHRYWRTRYQASHSVLGRRVTLGNRRFTIVGVMPFDLDYPAGVEVWRATHTVPTDGPFGDAARREVDLVARLRPGRTLTEATSALQALLGHLEEEGEADRGSRGAVANVRRFEDAIVGDARRPLLALLAAVALVLAIACANVANLQLMRAEQRRGELAVHAALGAGWSRLARHVVLETLMLGGAAAAVATPLAWWSVRALVAMLPTGVPRLEAIGMDPTVAGFVVALPLLMTVIASFPAVLFVRRGSIVDALAHGSRRTPASARGRRLLVIAQVALAVAVVAAAGVLVRGLIQLRMLDTGLIEDRLLFAELSLSGAAAQQARHGEVLDAIVARVVSLPGVVAATPVNAWPYAEANWDVPEFTADGQDADRAATNPALNFEAIGPRHFETLRVPIIHGRAFTADDRTGSIRVAIVSEDVATRTWPGIDPVGRRLKIGGPASGEPWLTIVGVAASTRYRELATAHPTLFVPAAQFLDTAERLAIRTATAPASVAPLIRGQIESLDPGIRVLRVATFGAIVAGSLAQPRFHATISGAFAVMAGLLAAIGLYAVLAASVRQRDREIAIRVAIGATPSTIRRLVLAEALGLATIGAAIGVAGALAAARLALEPMPGAPADDPLVLGAAVGLLLAAAVLAAYGPARRATRIDPVVSLRS
ncbi:MAG: ADOP family duplicated permease [Vicinamibacteraceae bacterium]